MHEFSHDPLCEDKTDAADGMQEFIGKWLVDFFTEASDVDINDVVERRCPLSFLPNVSGQHFPRHDPPLVPEEVFDDLKFLGGEDNGPLLC